MYVRRTRSITLSEVHATLARSFREHAEKKQLRLEPVRCWLTQRENPPARGIFGKLFGKRANSADPDHRHATLLMLHSTHILVGTHGEKRGTAILSAPHQQLSLSEASGQLAAASGPGFTLTGFLGAVHGQPASYFVGLGPEPDARACLTAVKDALVKAKNA